MQSQNFCPLKTIKTINPTVEHYGIYRYRCNENNKVKAISVNGTIDVCVYDASDAGNLRLTHEYRAKANGKDGKDFIKCTYPADSNYGCNLLIEMNKHNGILYKKEVWWLKDSPLQVEEVGNKKLSLT